MPTRSGVNVKTARLRDKTNVKTITRCQYEQSNMLSLHTDHLTIGDTMYIICFKKKNLMHYQFELVE